MFNWICAFTADCLTCHNNKPKPKRRNEVPLEEWQNETIPFRIFHIYHKGPLQPQSNRNLPCLFVIDAFSRFFMVTQLLTLLLRLQSLPSRNGSIHLESLNLLCMTEVRLSPIPNSLTGQKSWELPYNPELRTRFGLMAKLKPRTNTSPVFGGIS